MPVGNVGRWKPLRSIAHAPPSCLHHLNKANASNVDTCPIKRSCVHFRLRNVSSEINLQLTVHLYKNAREKSKARPRYDRGLACRNGIAMAIWVTRMIRTCRNVWTRPLVLKRISKRPGRYRSEDILIEREALETLRAMRMLLPGTRSWSFTCMPRCPDRPNLFETQGQQLLQPARTNNH
jgi:hypothetical protein